MGRRLLRIGHKGADALAPGNTLASFQAAVEAGVDIVELDVLRPRGDFAAARDWRRAEAGPDRASGPLLVAHDWGDAARRDPLSLAQVLDAFCQVPLDRVELDLDLKVAGREDEAVEMIRRRGLGERAMVSTMEIRSLRWLAEHEPGLRRGWTYPKVSRSYDRRWWARPLVRGALATIRRRLPARAARMLPALGVDSLWAYHPLATAELARACHERNVDLYAWTVDDTVRMGALAAMGVDGIVTNDPRLFAALEQPDAIEERDAARQ